MIIGTAGHIDHGKSALVTALTGKPVDRLAEERRRGITIDLNFAPLLLEGEAPAGIVDVPGHEDFVRTMVAGASGVDLVLLVVDAAQGAQPQTWEHLAIVEQLRIPRGIPVITKADLAEPEWIELIAEELAVRLGRSPVAFEPAAVVSAVTGQGIPELRERIRTRLRASGTRSGTDAFRMPVDRAFSLAGVGTVVTGTPWSGTLKVGDAVRILPGSGREARVRSIETYGSARESSAPGARTAVGLAGVERAALTRGDVLVTDSILWKTTTALDALVEMLPGTPPLRRRLRVHLHLGTSEVCGRLYPRPGAPADGPLPVRIALEGEILARGGDRFVLRSFSPVATIGGGVVVDPLPPRRAPWPEGLASADPASRAAALITRRSRGIAAADLPILLGLPADECASLVSRLKQVSANGSLLIAKEQTVALREEALRRVAAHHEAHPEERGISVETLRKSLRGPAEIVDSIVDGMIRRGELTAIEGRVATPGFVPRLAQGEGVLDRLLAILEAARLTPPTVEELERETGHNGLLAVLRFAAQRGQVTGVESNRFFSPSALKEFLAILRELGSQGSFTPPMVRERTGLSRKFLIPLLEYADRAGVTRRVGDTRVII